MARNRRNHSNRKCNFLRELKGHLNSPEFDLVYLIESVSRVHPCALASFGKMAGLRTALHCNKVLLWDELVQSAIRSVLCSVVELSSTAISDRNVRLALQLDSKTLEIVSEVPLAQKNLRNRLPSWFKIYLIIQTSGSIAISCSIHISSFDR